MLRFCVLALCAGILCVTGLLADIFEAKIKKVDTERKTLTVTVRERDREYDVDPEAKITSVTKKGKKGPAQESAVAGGIKGLKEGADVMVWTQKRDGKEVITQVRVEPAKKK